MVEPSDDEAVEPLPDAAAVPRGADDDAAPDVESRLEHLLRDYGRFLHATIARICPRGLGIETSDIEQDARVRLWRALRRETDITHPASYLARVASTATIDAVRRVRARREEQFADATHESGAAVAPERPDNAEPTPEALLSGREIAEAVEAALQRLRANRGQAVRLYLQDFGSREVGELMGWSEPKARNLIYRGLNDLRRELRAEGIEYAPD